MLSGSELVLAASGRELWTLLPSASTRMILAALLVQPDPAAGYPTTARQAQHNQLYVSTTGTVLRHVRHLADYTTTNRWWPQGRKLKGLLCRLGMSEAQEWSPAPHGSLSTQLGTVPKQLQVWLQNKVWRPGSTSTSLENKGSLTTGLNY